MSDTTKTFVEFLKSLVVEKIEDQIPLERLLAAHRKVQNQKLHQMADAGTDVRDMAYDLSDSLGETKAVLATLLDEAKKRRVAVGSAEAAKTDKEYLRLCAEVAESRENVEDLEEMVKEGFKDSQDAIDMINEQTDNFARVARQDASLVRRDKMVGLREAQQEMREQILQVFPEDTSNVRERAINKIEKRERRLKSRIEVINAMWEHQKAGHPVEVAADAQGVMDEIEKSLK